MWLSSPAAAASPPASRQPPACARGRSRGPAGRTWPPAGGPGVQRWLKFVKYLPDFGIQPIAYCPENPSYPTLDPSLAT